MHTPRQQISTGSTALAQHHLATLLMAAGALPYLNQKVLKWASQAGVG